MDEVTVNSLSIESWYDENFLSTTSSMILLTDEMLTDDDVEHEDEDDDESEWVDLFSSM